MVVEVAASRVSDDRLMADIYGPAGIPVYWIVNLKARQIEVYTLIEATGNLSLTASHAFSRTARSVPIVIDGVEVGRLKAADILPRIEPVTGGGEA